MKEKIKENIYNPGKLEELYRENSRSFTTGFEEIYSESDKTGLMEFWKIRLDSDKKPVKTQKADLKDIFILIVACLIAGFFIKIPDLFSLNVADELFYEKNAAIIVFLGITIYVTLVDRIRDMKKLTLILTAFMIPALYVNLLPSGNGSATVNLVYIHLPLLMWCIFGIVYVDFNIKDKTRRIEYIKYNGDLAILSALIVIAGLILTTLTISLFSAIGINIQKFYTENIVLVGAVSVPVVATYIIRNHESLTNKIAPIIAAIFSPLVLLTAVIYLIAWTTTGKNPFSDREFLLIFNIMLLAVMGIIVFSVTETSISGKQKFNEMILFLLSVLTAVIDLIALSAIFYRLGAFGITPNRLAVLGSNLLILVNIVLIINDLYKVNFKKTPIERVGLTISRFLPVYAIWIVFVIFGFPLIFGVK